MLLNANGFKEFVKAAFRDPRNVSTIFPSQKFLAKALIQHAGIKEGDHVLELGCGSGAITRYIMEEKAHIGEYTGVEIDEELVEYLKYTFKGEKFLNVSADKLHDQIPDGSMDVVICSLPWTLFAGKLQEGITDEIYRVLKPGGRFTTYLCIHSLTYPGAPRAKKIFKRNFSDFEKRESIARNIPPANVYLGIK
jgi:phospholipid N-methyltransferase